MKSIEKKKKEAYERQLARKNRSPIQQMDILSARGVFCCREYAKLAKILCKTK